MKHLILALVLLLPCYAARTTVSDTLYRADGSTCSGTISLTWDTFTSTTGQLIQAGRLSSTVSSGSLSVSLEPGTYQVRYQMIPSNCLPVSETWVVPASGTPVNLAAVRALHPPASLSLIPPAWIAPAGAIFGQALLFDGAHWAPGTVSGGGSGSMTWPDAAGVALYSGSGSWSSSLSLTGSGTRIATAGSAWSAGSIAGINIQGDLYAMAPLSSLEGALGNPPVDGYLLSSSAAGVRSWGPPGSSYTGCTPNGSNGITCTGPITASSFTSTESGPTTLSEQAAPVGSPAAGAISTWPDSTNHVQKWKDSSGNISQTYRNQSCPTGQHLSAMNADGTASCSADTGGSVAAYGTVTDGSPAAWDTASAAIANATLTLNHSTSTRALNVTNLVNGGFYTLILKQDSTGGAAMTLGTGCTWKVGGGGSGAITLSSAANAIDVLAFTYDGTNCYANLRTNFN